MPLVCPSAVQRGQEIACQVASPQLAATGWSFVPDDSLPEVQEQTSAQEWRGIAAAGGTVTVHVTDGVTPRDYSRRFTVVNRPSPWASLQSYREGPEPTAPDVEPDIGVTLGRNCPEVLTLCIPNQSRVQPSPFDSLGAGFTAQRIPSGPNRGYWFVASARYEMKRVGNVNPAILANSWRTHALPGSVPKKCRQGLGFGPKDSVFANFHRYNLECQNLDMEGFVAAVWGHEGFGHGGGAGHESLARAAASQTGNDPHKAVDALVTADSVRLDERVLAAVGPIAIDITTRADDNPGSGPTTAVPSGNFPGGLLWFWALPPGQFTSQTIGGF